MAIMLSGCSWEGSIGRSAPIVVPPGEKEIIEPGGAVVVEPSAPVETVITGLSQAQTTRALVRQLAR
jgi:hypothetical protein